MAIAIEIVPDSGDIIAVVTAAHITVTGAEDTDSSTYDDDALPTERVDSLSPGRFADRCR